jgi:hypothetical protein
MHPVSHFVEGLRQAFGRSCQSLRNQPGLPFSQPRVRILPRYKLVRCTLSPLSATWWIRCANQGLLLSLSEALVSSLLFSTACVLQQLSCTGCTQGPTNPANGVFNCGSNIPAGRVCNGTCNQGFVGSPTATCTSGGVWCVTGSCNPIGKPVQLVRALNVPKYAGIGCEGRHASCTCKSLLSSQPPPPPPQVPRSVVHRSDLTPQNKTQWL